MSLLWALAAFVAATYALRVAGVLLPAAIGDADVWTQPLTAAVLSSLVITSTVIGDHVLDLDARMVGVGVAIIAAARGASLLVTVSAAMATTALVRLLT